MNKTKPTTTKKGKLPLVKEDIKEETIVAVETKARTPTPLFSQDTVDNFSAACISANTL